MPLRKLNWSFFKLRRKKKSNGGTDSNGTQSTPQEERTQLTPREEEEEGAESNEAQSTFKEGTQSTPSKEEGADSNEAQSTPNEERTQVTPKEDGKQSTPVAGSAWAEAYDGVKTTLRLAAEATSGVPVPGLQGAIKSILFVMDNIDRASQNLDDFKSLGSHLEACRSVFSQYNHESFPPAIKEAIQVLSSQIQIACDDISPIVDHSRIRRILASSEDASLVQTKVRDINDALARFQLATTVFNALQTSESVAIGRRLLIDKLTNVEGAHYNSFERRHVTGCLPNTRVEVIKHIMDWLHEPAGPPMLWLHGTAGTGKSTVAQSIAESCAANGTLAGHFFFSRDKHNRFSMDGFFSTLARQMGSFELRLVRHLAKVVSESANPSGVRNPEMFSHLLVQPLLQLKREVPALSFPMVVVIDALDECRDAKDAEEVLALLLDNDLGSQSPPILKFLITSRPEPHIQEVFNTKKEPLAKFTEYTLDTDSVDVELYLQQGLDGIRKDPYRSKIFIARQAPWPEPKDYEKLVSKAAGLFIYASTILKFVGDKDEDPFLQLKLAMDTSAPSRTYGELDSLYTHIISQVPNWKHVHEVLGAVIFVFEPLSAEELELLLGLNKGHAQLSLRRLHSVLVVPSDEQQSIQLAHPSFHDFLTTKERSGEQYLDPSVHHGKLVTACFNIIRDGCQAAWHTYKYANSAQRRLLRYVCEYWPYHLSKSDSSDPTLVQTVEEFINSLLRVWLDACIVLLRSHTWSSSLSHIFGSNILQSRPDLAAFLCHELDKFGVQISTKSTRLDDCFEVASIIFEEAIQNFPGGDPPHHFKCHHCIAQRRNVDSSKRTLHDTISELRAVIHSLPHDHEDRGVCLTEMALCHRQISRIPQSNEEDSEEIIDESEPLLHKALTLMLDDDSNKSVCCNSYGLTLLARFEATEDISDLNQAIARFQQALDLPSPSPSITATFQNNLGSALANRFSRTHADEDASAALTALEAASNHPSAPPSVAFKASLSRARCLKSRGQDSPLPAYRLALKKAIRISWTALSGDEARTLWHEAIACGDEASIIAIEEGDIWSAVECFDQSCTTFWMDGLQLRRPFFPISQEQSRSQTLAVFLERERDQEPACTSNVDRGEFPPPTEIATLLQEYDGLLQSQSDGVEMAASLRYKQFMATHPEFCREGGRIILLCADESRTFALVLKPEVDDVLCIPLSIGRKRLDEIQSYRTLWNYSPGSDGKAVLQDSWDLVAKPIISALGLKPGMPLTRTWWCASTPFMDLPIHAATDYEANPHEYLTDYMISSYIPSLSYLFSKNHIDNNSTTRRSGLLCLPPTGIASNQDITAISGIVPREQLLLLPEPTEVLSKMRACSGVHVASQSWQMGDGPSRGGFLLPNGAYFRLDELLSEPSLPSFAYLSTYPMRLLKNRTLVCRLPYDLLATGFSSIIVALTDLSPEDAAAMASAFYTELLREREKLDFTFAPHALHAAMIKIRNECGDEPRRNWVRTIHVGF